MRRRRPGRGVGHETGMGRAKIPLSPIENQAVSETAKRLVRYDADRRYPGRRGRATAERAQERAREGECDASTESPPRRLG